ncbi:MAG: hypothetical protein RL538_485 [Candidatus Parcubacteria bacterium]
MVRRTIKAVAKRLSPEPIKVPERRLLVVIRALDGDLVLQKKRDDHQPRHHYDAEARTLLQTLFPPRPEKYCAKAKAEIAFHEVLKFKRASDTYAKGHFGRRGIQWHPVIVDIAYAGLDTKTILEMAKKGKGLKTRILSPLEGHEFAEELLKRFPRN